MRLTDLSQMRYPSGSGSFTSVFFCLFLRGLFSPLHSLFIGTPVRSVPSVRGQPFLLYYSVNKGFSKRLENWWQRCTCAWRV